VSCVHVQHATGSVLNAHNPGCHEIKAPKAAVRRLGGRSQSFRPHLALKQQSVMLTMNVSNRIRISND
jgi:hypothetical protein